MVVSFFIVGVIMKQSLAQHLTFWCYRYKLLSHNKKLKTINLMRFPKLAACCTVLALFIGTAYADGFDLHPPSATPLPPYAPITIGMSNALTGPTSALGTDLRAGAQIYFDKINRQGGIHGRKLNLASYDDGYEPTVTISNTRTLLKKDNAFLLFGYVGTPTSRVAVPIARHLGVPYIAPFTGAGFLRQPVVPVVFNIRASYADETEAMVKYLTEKLHFTRIGLFIQDDAYGSAGRTGVRKALEKRNMQVVAVGKYTRNTSDILPALNKLRAANPQAVIMVGAYAPSAVFIKQARKIGFNPVFMNVSFVGTQQLAEALGQEGEGVYITQVMPPPHDTSLPLISAYQADAASSTVPNVNTSSYGTLEGYINANVLVHIISATGPVLSRAAFISTSENLGQFNIKGLAFSFSPTNHQGSNRVYLTRIQSGTVVPVSLQ